MIAVEQLDRLDGFQSLIPEVGVILVTKKIFLIFDKKPDAKGRNVLNACQNVFAMLRRFHLYAPRRCFGFRAVFSDSAYSA